MTRLRTRPGTDWTWVLLVRTRPGPIQLCVSAGLVLMGFVSTRLIRTTKVLLLWKLRWFHVEASPGSGSVSWVLVPSHVSLCVPEAGE